ncbi:MAG: hypothetical protein K0R63_717 [Rickettsiales bacterium]|nr:hypothetical protein [Rickettsiales bacterium]
MGQKLKTFNALLMAAGLMALLTLSACVPDPKEPDSIIKKALRPMPWIFNQMPKTAPEEYQRGWKEGCESGMASMTNDYYKTFYTFKQSPELITNETYYKAWKDVYTFCRHYSYGIIREADVRMRTPDDPDQFSLEGQGIGNMFPGYGGGTSPKSVFGNNAGNSDFLSPKSDSTFDMNKDALIGTPDGLFGTGAHEKMWGDF